MCHTHTHESDSEVNNHINTRRCKCLSDVRQKEQCTVSSLLYERKQHSLCAISPVTLTRLCAITLHLNVSRQPRNIHMSPFFYLSLCDGMPGDVPHYHIHKKGDCIRITALLVSVTNTS